MENSRSFYIFITNLFVKLPRLERWLYSHLAFLNFGRLEKMGALKWEKVVRKHQSWRLISCIWLHAGIIHLVVNMLSLVFIGIRLEQQFGFGMLISFLLLYLSGKIELMHCLMSVSNYWRSIILFFLLSTSLISWGCVRQFRIYFHWNECSLSSHLVAWFTPILFSIHLFFILNDIWLPSLLCSPYWIHLPVIRLRWERTFYSIYPK